MSLFDTHVVVDWSGGNDAGPRPRKDAIWACSSRDRTPIYLRNRHVAEEWLAALIQEECDADRRCLIGFDFPFGYPQGFAQAVTGSHDPLALWDWLEARIEDHPDHNNRCHVASGINAQSGGIGPFWGNPFRARDFEHLPRKGLARTNTDFPERRAVEDRAEGSFTCWQLAGAGAVGSQVLMGLPVLARLRRRFAGQISVWPFEALDSLIAFVEIWPSLIASQIAQAQRPGEIKDAAQMRVLSHVLASLDKRGRLKAMLAEGREGASEGWILGVGHEAEMAQMAQEQHDPAALANDCFALPQGVDWTSVDDALALLKERMQNVTQTETIPTDQSAGRVLAQDVLAQRANPPAANSAIDGYGFAFDHMAPDMPLNAGRAVAGDRFQGVLPAGQAVRILTGAVLPEGVDTVVMQEECEVSDGRVALSAKVKRGQNTRKAGEDVGQGEMALKACHTMRAQDVALLTALGVANVTVATRLRVGVLSTGDELIAPTSNAPPDRTFDANRPMLLSLVERWGYEPVDLGHVADNRDALRDALNAGAGRCDVILTSGGASAGDADHVSAILSQEGALTSWRIAIKPGRPLALAMWNGTPIFGLPGNPVAAFTCALIFARPSFSVLAGGVWSEPQGFMVPAAFSKSKKQGRREFSRARLTQDGHAEVFKSEGSGRISGLSWAEGFVELADPARDVTPGDLVRYVPFASYGL